MKEESYPVTITYIGATGRAMQWTAKLSDGTVYNIAGLTLKLTAEHNNVKKLDGVTCSVTDGAAGEFEYTDSGGALDEPGQYDAQVFISDTPDYLEPFYIDVRTPID
jgi:hypothetical protein